MSPILSTPHKPSPTANSQFFPTSPRLRSPRGSPRNNGSSNAAPCIYFGLLRHTRCLLLVVSIVIFGTWQRPENPGTNLSLTSIDTMSPFDVPGTINRKIRARVNASSVVVNRDYDNIATTEASFSVDEQEAMETQPDVTREANYNSWQGLPVDNSNRIDAIPDLSQQDTTITTPSSSSSSKVLFESYNASLHPVFDFDQVPKIQVHFVVDVSHSIGPQSKFMLDGLERSQHTQVVGITFLTPHFKELQVGHTRDKSVPMVWIIDWGSMHRDCHRLAKVLTELKRKSKELVVLVDYSGSARQTSCGFWDPHFRLAKRAIVEGRHYHAQKMDQGSLADNTGTPGGNPIVHAPLALREKTVKAMQDLMGGTNNPLRNSKRRNIDVSFFWKQGDYSHYGFWRREIAKVVQGLNGASITTLVGIVSTDEEGMEEGNVQVDYVKKLLASKIVVIAQRDEWEDQYRLMESLASGALVLMDQMLAPPAGLKNKTNVVVYDSPQSLERLIRYYLHNNNKRHSIAKRGFQLSMGQHRSWHQMEHLLFGKPLTHVDKPYESAPVKEARPKLILLQDQVVSAR